MASSQGAFPAYTVVTGNISAKIGFLTLADGTCGTGNAKFQLNYKEGAGTITPLGEWTETCDGTMKSIDVDLTPLKGKTVEFVLAVLANGSSARTWLYGSTSDGTPLTTDKAPDEQVGRFLKTV